MHEAVHNMEDFPEEVPLTIPPSLKSHLEDDCFWILRRNRLVRLPRKPTVETILRDYYLHCSANATEETNLSLLAEILDGIKIHFDFMLADHLLFVQERSQYKQAVEERREQERNVVKTVRNRTGQSETEGRLQKNGTAVNSLPQQGSLENSTDPVGSKMEVDSRQVSRAPSPSDSQPLMPSGIYGAEHLLRLFVRIPLFLSRAQLPTAHIQTLHHCFKDLLEYLCSRRQELFSEECYEDTVHVATDAEDELGAS